MESHQVIHRLFGWGNAFQPNHIYSFASIPTDTKTGTSATFDWT